MTLRKVLVVIGTMGAGKTKLSVVHFPFSVLCAPHHIVFFFFGLKWISTAHMAPSVSIRGNMTLRKVLVVIGTTGAGKTKLSVDLAKAVGGEIVNSDAMQMYRGLDVATAKITEKEKQGVPHHLFDVVDPSSRCDVLEFKRLALQTIDDILSRGKVPVVVGGTMYYTQSILWKSQLLDDVPVKDGHQEQQQQEQQTPEDLFARLQAVDPAMAARLHVNNVRKVQRSLQVFDQTGVPHSELLAQQEREQRNVERYFDACAFWVHASKPVLSERLAKRVDTMLSSGLVDEIRGLRAHVKENPPRLHPDSDDEEEAQNSVGILQAIGYKEFQPYLDALEAADGSADDPKALQSILDACVEQLNVATRQYARRQLTWIRNKFVTKNIPVYQVDSSDVAQWDALVAQPAIDIAGKFLKNEKITSHQTVQEQRPEAAQAATLEDKFETNTCAVCDREFTGKKQWGEHLRSKGHKYHLKRVQIEKERAEHGEPPYANKRRRQAHKQGKSEAAQPPDTNTEPHPTA
jgi:tRNA dimethylallyltransferase